MGTEPFEGFDEGIGTDWMALMMVICAKRKNKPMKINDSNSGNVARKNLDDRFPETAHPKKAPKNKNAIKKKKEIKEKIKIMINNLAQA